MPAHVETWAAGGQHRLAWLIREKKEDYHEPHHDANEGGSAAGTEKMERKKLEQENTKKRGRGWFLKTDLDRR